MSPEGVTPSLLPHRLGVHLVEGGANVGVYAGHATGVDLCLFDEEDNETRIPLFGPKAGVWHAFVPGIEVHHHDSEHSSQLDRKDKTMNPNWHRACELIPGFREFNRDDYREIDPSIAV